MGSKTRLDSTPAAAGRRPEPAAPVLAEDPGSRLAWSRIGLLSLWVIAFGLIAARVASSFEKIVGSLASAPRQETLR
jgi:hypothetical protein